MALSKMDCPNDTISTGHLAAVGGGNIHTEVAKEFNIKVLSNPSPGRLSAILALTKRFRYLFPAKILNNGHEDYGVSE